jgi:hypothetical protein
VVPSEGSTQATEAKWAHLRALFHRGSRRFGREWLLAAFTDDQMRLVYGDEYLLPEDIKADRGQSLLSRELAQAGRQELTREVDKNTVLSAWVMKLPGITEDFARFEKLFLQPPHVGQFRRGTDYWLATGNGRRGAVLAATAREETHHQATRETRVSQSGKLYNVVQYKHCIY